MPQDNVKYPQYGELFYSMDIGPVHAVVIDDSWVAEPSGDPSYAGILQTWLTAGPPRSRLAAHGPRPSGHRGFLPGRGHSATTRNAASAPQPAGRP